MIGNLLCSNWLLARRATDYNQFCSKLGISGHHHPTRHLIVSTCRNRHILSKVLRDGAAKNGTTVLTIAHRLNTILDFDRWVEWEHLAACSFYIAAFHATFSLKICCCNYFFIMELQDPSSRGWDCSRVWFTTTSSRWQIFGLLFHGGRAGWRSCIEQPKTPHSDVALLWILFI